MAFQAFEGKRPAWFTCTVNSYIHLIICLKTRESEMLHILLVGVVKMMRSIISIENSCTLKKCNLDTAVYRLRQVVSHTKKHVL